MKKIEEIRKNMNNEVFSLINTSFFEETKRYMTDPSPNCQNRDGIR